MSTRTHVPGFVRMGADQELEFAIEEYRRGELDLKALEKMGAELRARRWQSQRDAGLAFVTVGDFAFHDQVAHHIQLLGCEPPRFDFKGDEPELSRHFRMARGAGSLEAAPWLDTDCRYLVPEFTSATRFGLASVRLFEEVAQAQAAGHPVKAVLLGPLSFLYLGKEMQAGFDRLSLLDALLPVYEHILGQLKKQGVEWVQIDEPILGLDLPGAWRNAFERSYWQLARSAPKLLLAACGAPLSGNLRLACQLPVAGLHVDAVRAPQELVGIADWLPWHKVLSVGIIDGGHADPDAALARLKPVTDKHRGELWIAPSRSLVQTLDALRIVAAMVDEEETAFGRRCGPTPSRRAA